MSNIVYMVVWRRNWNSSYDEAEVSNLRIVGTDYISDDPRAAIDRAYKNTAIHPISAYCIVTLDTSTRAVVDVSLASEFKERG